MFTKSANSIVQNHKRDEAIKRLNEPEVTKGKGIGIPSVVGGILGTGASLLTRRPRLGKAIAGATAGAGAGAGLGYLGHKDDQEERGSAKNYLKHYNTQRMRQIMRQRYLQRRQAALQRRRQAAAQGSADQ